MVDALGERCGVLAGPVVALMQAVMGSQVNPVRFVEVAERAREIHTIIQRSGPTGDPAFDRWATTAPTVLGEIVVGAENGDRDRVWTAFADPRAGLSVLANACAGHPGW
ncbi:hypothetical protein [Curtobacterium pusillum]|uniref:hypothetical protein n=1 Tax=Curtobacterium pusillum TaxID=69373 RepID=UPI0011A0A1AE|nr:hypothetical protein [Curtobacterium pusillum]